MDRVRYRGHDHKDHAHQAGKDGLSDHMGNYPGYRDSTNRLFKADLSTRRHNYPVDCQAHKVDRLHTDGHHCWAYYRVHKADDHHMADFRARHYHRPDYYHLVRTR